MYAEIKVEQRNLSGSRYLDQTPMYPGIQTFQWCKAPWGWTLISITPKDN